MKNPALIPAGATECDITKDVKAARALANAETKYPHVKSDRVWRAADGRHLLVIIKCQVPNCEGERCCATSDAFQTTKCLGAHGEESKKPTAKKGKTKGSKGKSHGKARSNRTQPKKGKRKARKARAESPAPASVSAE